MVDINGYEIKSAFSGGEPLKAIYSLGEKVWPVAGPVIENWGGLTFTALEAGEIGMEHYGTNATTTKPKISYSKNGYAWVDWDYTPISVSTGDVVYFNGVNDKISSSTSNYSNLTSTGKIAGSGNIMSLLYGDDYEGKVDLSGKGYCFCKLLYNCSNLTTAPELPATTLGGSCYWSMFEDCKSLTTAPELPSTTLAGFCYVYMFKGCTSLTTAPSLPATTLLLNCYYGMFSGCTSLTTAPELTATTLADECYRYMFNGCKSLTTAPKLPATTLADYCYGGMFSNCTSLTTAPELKSTTLAKYCYDSMFSYCTSLVNAPELKATTLANYCYYSMFRGCDSLTTAPELPATTLLDRCYDHMFSWCSKLNYVKANFTTTPSSNYTDSWLSGVASTGTFVANNNATWPSSITRGASTIPEGWNIEQKPVVENWGGLTFTALEAGSIGMTHNGTNATTTKPKLSYSKNGYYWVNWDYTPISVNSGDVVYFKGVNNSISSVSSNLFNSSTFTSTGKFEASGNIMSLLYGVDYEGQVSLSGKDYCFESLFSGCTGITTAPELPATTLSTGCYYYMFKGCTSLNTAPELPATTLETWCCYGMFSGCTSLTTAPELTATTLKYYCYNSMFYGCTNLTTAPALPATILSDGCYVGMFSGCTGLTTAPELPATTLSDGCYNDMFKGCTNLNYVKANFTTTPSSNYTDSWLSGVASTGTFVANPSASWTTSITRNESTVPAGWTITK